jgi:hypothetical protein
MEILLRSNGKTVSLCEKFDMPCGTPYKELNELLQQRFEIAKKLHFPDWEDSWWDIHIPTNNGKSQVVEWYTHMPVEHLLTEAI